MSEEESLHHSSENPSPISSAETPELGREVETVESLRRALEEEKAKSEKYLANWQRSEADFANYRKRSEQERGDNTKFANTILILNLLPIIDDMERALSSIPSKLARLSWVNGIELIYRKLKATLEAQGLAEIKALGETFDPRLHEAVMQGEGDEGKVIDVAQKGYQLHEKILRPTMAVVGRGEENKAHQEQQENESRNPEEEE